MAADNKTLQKELAVAHSLRNKVEVLIRFASAFRERGDLKQAIALSEQAIGLAVQADKQGQPFPNGLAESLALLGECLFDSDKPTQALDALLRALKESEEIGNQHQMARLHLLLGGVYAKLEVPFEARKHFSEGARLAKEVGDGRLLAESLQGHGEASLELKDSQGALASLRESLQAFSDMGDRRGQALILANLSRAYASLGDYEHAFGYGQQGVKLCAQASLRTEEVEQLIDLGKIYLQQGSQIRAMACYQDAQTLAQARHLAYWEAKAWFGMSELYELQGQADLATSAVISALEIAQRLEASDLALECHRKLAESYRLTGQDGRAVEHLEQVCELQERNYVQEVKRHTGYLEVIHQVELDVARRKVDIARDRVSQLEDELHAWQKVERLMDEREERNKALIDELPIGFYRISPDGKIFDVNAAALRMLGREALEGFMDREPSSDDPETTRRRELRRQVKEQGRIESLETVIQRVGSTPLVLRERIQAIKDVDGKLVFYEGILEDISRLKQLEEDLEDAHKILDLQVEEIERLQDSVQEQVVRDPLTGLFNQRYLQETLERELARSRRKRRLLSMILLDVDDFDQFNQTNGRFVGDRLLQALADLLCKTTRGEDVVSRIGADEFVILLIDAPLRVAFEKANNFRMGFGAHRLSQGGKQLQATFSAGVVGYPKHGLSSEELFQAAEQTLKEAKEAGKNRVLLRD